MAFLTAFPDEKRSISLENKIAWSETAYNPINNLSKNGKLLLIPNSFHSQPCEFCTFNLKKKLVNKYVRKFSAWCAVDLRNILKLLYEIQTPYLMKPIKNLFHKWKKKINMEYSYSQMPRIEQLFPFSSKSKAYFRKYHQI